MTTYRDHKSKRSVWSWLKESLNSEHQDFTTGSIRKAIFLLAIPMILEMCMESVFALVDIFFVGKLGSNAITTVGLTESFLTIIYSLAIGLSMAATALVARRVGEKNFDDAAKAGAQAAMLCFSISIAIGSIGLFFAGDVLRLMGASPEVLAIGSTYTRIMLTGNVVIMLLFLINGIFRGAGDAGIAMRSLWLANACNIILCPLLIHFFGLPGAAMATTTGRGIGVCYQVYRLFKGKGVIKIHLHHYLPDMVVVKSIFKIASTASLQFLIGSASWIALARIVSAFGSDAFAGYTVAIRLVIFFLMPAWGFSNAAATLVGQNLGAKQPDRAEESVLKTAKYNGILMGAVSLLFILFPGFFVGLINHDPGAIPTGVIALRVMSFGFVFWAVGMVMTNAFNGAGDSKTPTWINFFWFWIFQIPVAYLLADVLKMGPTGVFITIIATETGVTITSVILFKKGKWKTIKI